MPNLLKYQDTVSRSHTLGQLCNTALIEVGPREAAMVKIDLRAAVLPIRLACWWHIHTHTHKIKIVSC